LYLFRGNVCIPFPYHAFLYFDFTALYYTSLFLLCQRIYDNASAEGWRQMPTGWLIVFAGGLYMPPAMTLTTPALTRHEPSRQTAKPFVGRASLRAKPVNKARHSPEGNFWGYAKGGGQATTPSAFAATPPRRGIFNSHRLRH
jgi:hypothetical protein